MPRTGRGGRREGTPGKAYANRTDLNMPSGGATHMPDSVRPYGDRTLPSELQTGPRPSPTAAPQSAPARGVPVPLSPLDAPTERPDEPITAGMGGPPKLNSILSDDPDELIRVLYRKYGGEDLRRLMERRG